MVDDTLNDSIFYNDETLLRILDLRTTFWLNLGGKLMDDVVNYYQMLN